MGWSTELFCNISFNRKTYNSIYEVEKDIDECKSMIQLYIDKLRTLAVMTEPQKMINCKDCEGNPIDPIDLINTEFNRIVEEMDDYKYDLFKLEYLRDNWKYCHNDKGLAIDPPENIQWDTAFLDGDFVKTVKYPNGDSL